MFYMNGLLDLLAMGSVLAGILVITSSNPVISVLFLVTVFALGRIRRVCGVGEAAILSTL